MKIVVANESTPLARPIKRTFSNKIIPVFLGTANDQMNFRCIHCGLFLFTFDDAIAMIIPDIAPPMSDRMADIGCVRCGITYRLLW